MLFTPLKRPLDLKGTSDLNRAVDERHFINSESDRIFVPQLGPFFKDSMVIVDVLTGNTLVELEDYRLLHMVSAATNESNKEITCVVYLLNKTISEVLITYQAIGGIYAEGSIALLEILERFKDAKLPPVYWANIINLPDTFPVTPHKHTLFDLEGLEAVVSALTKVHDALVGRDIPKFQTLYDNLDKVILDLENKGADYAQTLEQGLMRIESNMLYRKGNVKITDINDNPFDYLGYGSWVRLENVFLYGQMAGESTDPITNISNGTGHVARVTNFWEQISDVEGMSFTLTASSTTINEGQSVTFVLRTSGLTEGTLLPYKIDGVNESDITTPLSGNFVINDQGTASVTITTREDRLSEGAESLGLYLENYTSIRRSVRVNDTSRSPSFSVYYTSDIEGKNQINSIDEGNEFYIFIQSEFVDDGQVINLFYNGSTTANADFNTSLPTQLTISGGRATYLMQVKADQLTEGNEILFTGVSLSSADAILASNVLTLRDSSKTPGYNITYSASDIVVAPLTELTEGAECWAIIQTENISNGTVLGIQNGGTINDADFDIRYPSSVTIQNGTAKFKMKIVMDSKTEGVETLNLNLMVGGISVYSKSINVLDTSVNPNADMRFSTNSSGTNNITTATEFDVVYLVVTTQNTPNGTAFNLTYGGSADASDFVDSRPSTVVINDNRGVVRYSIKPDKTNEPGDNETMIVNLVNQFTLETMGTVTLSIKDTSKASTYAIRFSANENGTGTITNVNEGEVCYGIIETKNVDDGTVLYVDTTIGGKVATIANGDVSIGVQSTVVIQNNFASVKVALNNDMQDENSEALVMYLREDVNVMVGFASITVNDTSKAPTYASRLLIGDINTAPNESSPVANNVLVDVHYSLLIQTTNVPDGTVLYVRRNDAVEPTTGLPYLSEAAWGIVDSIAPVSSVVIRNNKAMLSVRVGPSYITDGNKALTLGVYTSASGGAPVTTLRTTFANPGYDTWFSSNANGTDRITAINEGQTAYLIIEMANVPFGNTVTGQIFVNGVMLPDQELVWDVTDGVNTTARGYILNALRNVFPYQFKADQLREGNESFRIRLTPYGTDISSPSWVREAILTIVDTSYRASKIRARVDANSPTWKAASGENFDNVAFFITPEGDHEGWSVTLDSAQSRYIPLVFGRSGTSRSVVYSGLINMVAIDTRRGFDQLQRWQKSYHNEMGIDTIYSEGGLYTMGANNQPIFVSPWASHEAWTITRNADSTVLNVFDRSGTNRIGYNGKIAITSMAEYKPHYGEHLEAGYPRVVMAGTSYNNDPIWLYDMFPYNLNDTTKYVLMFCPEGEHEGWTLSRQGNKIVPNIYNRSGQNRIGYNGRNSYAVIQLRADDALDPTNRYIFARPGNHNFTFKKGNLYTIQVIGAGGAGGNAIWYHSGATQIRAGSGGTSVVHFRGYLYAAAGGGEGGTRGNWNNGSAFNNGANGNGGVTDWATNEITANLMDFEYRGAVNGNPGYMWRYNEGWGGVNNSCPERTHFATGGKGMYGSGDDQWGFGGSGGGGGFVEFRVRTKQDFTAEITVGSPGAPYNDPNEYYQANWHYGFGGWGNPGMIIITDHGPG